MLSGAGPALAPWRKTVTSMPRLCNENLTCRPRRRRKDKYSDCCRLEDAATTVDDASLHLVRRALTSDRPWGCVRSSNAAHTHATRPAAASALLRPRCIM